LRRAKLARESGFDGVIAFHIYNEPLIDPRLFSFIEYARRICPQGRILILTNGFLDMLDGCVARARGTAGPFGSFVDKIIDKYADLIFLLGMMLGGLAHPVAVIVSMVGIPLATYINAAVESLTKGEVKFQEKLSLRFLRIILLVAGGLSHQTHFAVWLVAATVVYAVVSRMIGNLVFLRRAGLAATRALTTSENTELERKRWIPASVILLAVARADAKAILSCPQCPRIQFRVVSKDANHRNRGHRL
jgi:phosphatidylglycerophosphate synthase